MGESIEKTSFDEQDLKTFSARLRKETQLLMKMFEERAFEYSEVPHLGLEVEAWLLDSHERPNPVNNQFLKGCNDINIVEELAKFNFELNTPPVLFKEGCFQKLHSQLKETWKIAQTQAESIGSHPCLIGIHPKVSDEVLRPEFMSDGNRYKALNQQILAMRHGQEIKIKIDGRNDSFNKNLNHIMMEAAATSIQVHIQANQENIKRVYNASLIASTPAVAIAANSPFFYGHELWEETRIPLFEQAIRIASFRNKKGESVGRVTFGTGYVRHSIFELFLENLDGYPPLLPILFDEDLKNLHHLTFHNGTLWRWNRPIIGSCAEGKPHLRIEQRVMASGPSIVDIIANAAFSIGLTSWYSDQEKIPEESMTFTDCNSNFYKAARHGLKARVCWFGKEVNLNDLILEELIPKACEGLKIYCDNSDEINFYIKEIIEPRVRSMQNGSHWQRSFIAKHGKDFQALSAAYTENQFAGDPVHQWKL